MTPQQKQLIRELVQKYSEHIGTESLIAYVAETNGMLTACKTLLQTIKTGNSVSTDWLFRDCLKYNIVYHLFIEEISRVIVLFDPDQENEDHYATLGLAPEANQDEIKQAYRTLVPQYHPDTAPPLHRDKPEKFIEINKAYNALLTAQDTEKVDGKSGPSKQWRKSRARRPSSGQKKKLFMWASATLVILAVVSTLVLITVNHKAMLAGLQKGRTIFVESVDRVLISMQPATVKESSRKQQKTADQNELTIAPSSSSEKPLLAAPEEQIEQKNDIENIYQKPTSEHLSPDRETTGDTARLPDAQKIPDILTSPDRIDTPEAHLTETVKDETVEKRSDEQPRTVEQNELAAVTASASEKPLLAVPEEQGEQTENTGLISLKPTPEHLSPAPETVANTAKLPDAQKLPVIVQYPDRIDTREVAPAVVQPPLENQQSVADRPEQNRNNKSASPDDPIQISAIALPVEKKQVQPDIQSRIDTFLANYVKAYQQRNLNLFTKFFTAGAIENGKPFTSELPTYKEFFATASDISLKVEKITWQRLEGKIDVQGTFTFYVQYNDSRTFSGTGPIHFVLLDNNTSLQITILEYDFVDEN